MSILDRLSLNRHLDDTALAGMWTDSTLDGGERRAHPHLDACAACRSRYAALDAWLQEVGAVARAEADDVFPADRLAAQQNQIMRRLEALERPARVIVFPKHLHAAAGDRGARRWIAAAAAAGLVVGIAAGQLLDLRDALGGPTRQFAEQRPAEAVPTVANIQPAVVTSLQSDEAFLSELEDASLSPRVPELAALDAFTPRLRDISERSQ
jgi:hypothetical protein